MEFVFVGVGGAVGAMIRYGVSLGVAGVWGIKFPLATLLINIAGSLAMGVLVGLLARFMPPWQNEARLLLAVGVLGGFTTFSSFSLDAITLLQRGEIAQAAVYVLVSVVVSVVALYLGLMISRGSPA